MNWFVRLLAIVLAFWTIGGVAAESDWLEIAPGARARLVTDNVLHREGNARAGLEVELAAGLRTYWRVPGQAGIPATLDWSNSTGIGSLQEHWPYPRREIIDGLVEYVYFDRLMVPLILEMSDETGVLSIDLLMGVCSEICVPVSATLDVPIDFDRPSRGNGLRLRQGEAAVPQMWPGAGELFGDVWLDDAKENLLIEVGDEDFDLDGLIVDAGLDGPLFGVPQKGPIVGVIEVPLLSGLGTDAGELQDVQLTFMSGNRPFVLHRYVQTRAGRVVAAQ